MNCQQMEGRDAPLAQLTQQHVCRRPVIGDGICRGHRKRRVDSTGQVHLLAIYKEARTPHISHRICLVYVQVAHMIELS
jgi:hypothetical protein